jgi:hypothetical protein
VHRKEVPYLLVEAQNSKGLALRLARVSDAEALLERVVDGVHELHGLRVTQHRIRATRLQGTVVEVPEQSLRHAPELESGLRPIRHAVSSVDLSPEWLCTPSSRYKRLTQRAIHRSAWKGEFSEVPELEILRSSPVQDSRKFVMRIRLLAHPSSVRIHI